MASASATCVTPKRLPSFGNHVGDIIQLRPEKQMARIYTPAIVATMQHLQPVRDRTASQNPCYAMRSYSAFSDTHAPIPVRVKLAQPRPTRIRFAALKALIKTRSKSRQKTMRQNTIIEIHPPLLWAGDRAGSSAANALPPAFSSNPSTLAQAALGRSRER